MAFTSVNPDDSQLFSEALHNWQEQNHDSHDFRDLTPAAQSAIVSDAQDLKAQTRAWYELQAALAASASRRSQ
jgi:hypothetical protein